MLEITEATLVAESAVAAETLDRLHREAFAFAVDDFGTGFSSLMRLQELPVGIIKINRSFVTAARSRPSTEMLQAIATLGGPSRCR